MTYQMRWKLLESFCNDWGKGKQRSEEWKQSMGYTVGGSELSVLLGENPYKKKMQLAKEKVEIRKGIFKSFISAACNWGVIFEDVTEMFINDDLCTIVYGSDICIRMFKGHRNSPDGIAIIRYYIDDDGYTQIWTKRSSRCPSMTSELITVLEFKSPITRRIGVVPPMYITQVKSGMSVCPISSIGLFVDAAYAKCIHQDFQFNMK